MEKKVAKLGGVGLRRGKDVVAGIVGDDNLVLRAICDKRQDRLQEAERFFKEEKRVENLLVFESYKELLRSDVDAVFVATDVPFHAEHAIQALEQASTCSVRFLRCLLLRRPQSCGLRQRTIRS